MPSTRSRRTKWFLILSNPLSPDVDATLVVSKRSMVVDHLIARGQWQIVPTLDPNPGDPDRGMSLKEV